MSAQSFDELAMAEINAQHAKALRNKTPLNFAAIQAICTKYAQLRTEFEAAVNNEMDDILTDLQSIVPVPIPIPAPTLPAPMSYNEAFQATIEEGAAWVEQHDALKAKYGKDVYQTEEFRTAKAESDAKLQKFERILAQK